MERTESEERTRYRVWYATREKLEHPWASLSIFTDRGSPELEPEGLWFQGQTLEFAVRNVLAVSLVGKGPPWRSYAPIIAAPLMGRRSARTEQLYEALRPHSRQS